LVCALTGCETESHRIRHFTMPEMDFASLPDGTRQGSASYHDSIWSVETRAESGVLDSIRVLSSPGSDYDRRAEAVLAMIVDRQRLDVDCVSGATRSSKLFLLAVLNALTGQVVDGAGAEDCRTHLPAVRRPDGHCGEGWPDPTRAGGSPRDRREHSHGGM
jgi:uncharacterized protein with FMN-binding domain